MAQKKRKKSRCTANGIPLAAKLARERMIRQAVKDAAYDASVRVESDICTQRALWFAVASIADAYGFGPERIKKFFVALQDNGEEYARMKDEVDEEYANEKLRLKAERVTGMQIQYLYEQEAREAQQL